MYMFFCNESNERCPLRRSPVVALLHRHLVAVPQSHHLLLSLVDQQVQLRDIHVLLLTFLSQLFVRLVLFADLVAQSVAQHNHADVLQVLLLQLPEEQDGRRIHHSLRCRGRSVVKVRIGQSQSKLNLPVNIFLFCII